MGKNQFEKMMIRDGGKRADFFGCMKPTIERPDLIVEEPDPVPGAERGEKLLFIKAFRSEDKVKFFVSVTVMKGGREVHVSFHPITELQTKNNLKDKKVLFFRELKGTRGATKMLVAPGLGSAEPDDAQSGHNRGSYPHTKNKPNPKNSQPKKQKSFVQFPSLIQKAKASSRRCPFCKSWKGTVVRVFSSYDEFAGSPFYGGEDLVINDPNATRAIWPGKNNVGRSASEWWICIPVHPYCGCHWVPWTPQTEDSDDDDFFAQMGRRADSEEYQQSILDRNRAAFEAGRLKSASVIHSRQIALLREAIRQPNFEKSAVEVSGVYHHHTCAHEDHEESWVRTYLRQWSKK